MTTATISLYCPPMPIYNDGVGLKRTGTEEMVATISLPNVGQLVIKNVAIPPTLVHRVGLMVWQVEACGAYGTDADGAVLALLYPAELTVIQGRHLIAKSITITGTLTLPDGTVGQVKLVQPDCACTLFPPPIEAQAVTAAGTVEFPGWGSRLWTTF